MSSNGCSGNCQRPVGEVKFTLRMPDSLRERLAERAKANDQSLNAWIIRCLEPCAAEAAQSGEQA